MRKPCLIMAAASAVLSAASPTSPANAMTLAAPAAIRAAAEDIAVTDKVHCLPGWLHHHWWYGYPHWDGCYRYRGVFVAPLIGSRRFVRHRFVGGARFVGGGARFVGGGARFMGGGARFGGGGARFVGGGGGRGGGGGQTGGRR